MKKFTLANGEKIEAEISTSDADGRCGWCGEHMKQIDSGDGFVLWKHTEPIEDDRCSKYLCREW